MSGGIGPKAVQAIDILYYSGAIPEEKVSQGQAGGRPDSGVGLITGFQDETLAKLRLPAELSVGLRAEEKNLAPTPLTMVLNYIH